MGRVYPPVWCETNNCAECEIDECNKKILDLFEPYRDVETTFNRRPKTIEITTIAIYFGYCQILGKFFLQFPQDTLPVVRANFIKNQTRLPTQQTIQRIFLDMLNRGDPNAPTDDVHKYRLLFFSNKMDTNKIKIGLDGSGRDIACSEKEIDEIVDAFKRWYDDFQSGKLTFKKSAISLHCKYCFLDNCEKV